MNNLPERVIIGNLVVDYEYEDQLTFLSLTMARRATGPLMFMWKPDAGVRVAEILQDSSSGLEVANDLVIGAFPLSEVVSLLNHNADQFADDLRNSILSVLRQAMIT